MSTTPSSCPIIADWVVNPIFGEMLIQFQVDGDPVPWRAPGVFRKIAVKPKRVREWEQHVALTGSRYYVGEPYDGPVEMHLVLVKGIKDKKKWGCWWDKRPDMDNLKKAIGDSLTGHAHKKGRNGEVSSIGRIILDDNQIVHSHVKKIYEQAGCVRITLFKIQ